MNNGKKKKRNGKKKKQKKKKNKTAKSQVNFLSHISVYFSRDRSFYTASFNYLAFFNKVNPSLCSK